MICLIVAMSENGIIGRGGSLPWHLPADLAHFKRLTTGHAIIMGRRTFESVGKPLPNRTNIIITSRRDFRPEGVEVAHSLEEALQHVPADEAAFIAGGAEVYRRALPIADRLYLTLIHADIEGDVHFPPWDEGEWDLTEQTHHPADERNEHAMTFRAYVRRQGAT